MPYYDCIEMGELLISKGADVNASDIIYQNIIKLFLMIIKQFKERNLNKNNKTPLHYAASSWRESNKMIELLISKGADINAKTTDIIYRNILLSFLIIKIQIKEWNLNKNNKTPLHIAAEKDSIKIGEILISKGDDINAKDNIYQNISVLFIIILKQI